MKLVGDAVQQGQFYIQDKGQIISEQKCGVLNFPRMQRNNC